jgi:hypothetical protein
MRPRLAFSLKLVIALIPVSLILAGCVRTVCIKTVDAATGRPLAGVSTSWRQDYDGYFHVKHEGPTNLPLTSQDGNISVGGLHRYWTSSFIFSCPGYSNVYGIYSLGELGLAERVRYFPPGPFKDEFFLEGKLTSASLSNGCFLIPMQK